MEYIGAQTPFFDIFKQKELVYNLFKAPTVWDLCIITFAFE